MNAAKCVNSHVSGQSELDPKVSDIEQRRHPGHFSLRETSLLRKARVPLKHPTGILFDKAETAILPGGSGPLGMPHRGAPHENFGVSAQQKYFDDCAGFKIETAFAKETVCADIFGRGQQVESLTARAGTNQLQNYLEPDSMVAPAFVVRAVDRSLDRGLKLFKIDRLFEEISCAEIEAKFAVFVGGLPGDDENGNRLRVADGREGLTELEPGKARHHQINENAVGLGRQRETECLGGIACVGYFERIT